MPRCMNLNRSERRRVDRLSGAELENEFLRDFRPLIAVLNELPDVRADRDEARTRQERPILKQLDRNRFQPCGHSDFTPVSLSSGTSTNLVTKSRQPRGKQHFLTLKKRGITCAESAPEFRLSAYGITELPPYRWVPAHTTQITRPASPIQSAALMLPTFGAFLQSPSQLTHHQTQS